MTKFTADNTEGYSKAELAELNRRFAEAVAAMDEEERAAHEQGGFKNVAERVLAEFDSEPAEKAPIRVDLSDLTYGGMPIEAVIENGRISVYCNGYLDGRYTSPPSDLAAQVREGFADMDEEMDEEDERDLPVWDEVETRIAEAWATADAR